MGKSILTHSLIVGQALRSSTSGWIHCVSVKYKPITASERLNNIIDGVASRPKHKFGKELVSSLLAILYQLWVDDCAADAFGSSRHCSVLEEFDRVTGGR